MRRAWLIGFACCLATTGAERDPVEVLKQVTQKVVAAARQTPHYTCVQTINREYFRPAAATLPRACDVLLEERRYRTLDMALQPFAADRLRLDVTLDEHGELFSWAGASKFDEAGVDHVVRNGPIGTGAFAGFLIAVFETDTRKFNFERQFVGGGRELMEFSFQVPKSDSHYKVKVADAWVNVAYGGTFQVDPETSDLLQMNVVTGDLPSALGQCLATNRMEFGMVRIGNDRYLLPTQMRQRFVFPAGEETENLTEFTNCREYRGESTVTFLASHAKPLRAGHAKSLKKPFLLPAGLPFSFELTAPIRIGTAAAGDAFAGKLTEPLRDEQARLLAPIGAAVEGPLMRVQSYLMPRQVVVILRPEAMAAHGALVPLTAVPSGFSDLDQFTLTPPVEENSRAFIFTGDHATVPKGFRSQWRTASSGN